MQIQGLTTPSASRAARGTCSRRGFPAPSRVPAFLNPTCPDFARRVRKLLKKPPEWHGHVRLVQIAVPSRGRIFAYRKFRQELELQVTHQRAIRDPLLDANQPSVSLA